MEKVIRIAAGLLVDADGLALVVRKQGAAVFMQPGGKIEPGRERGGGGLDPRTR